MILQRVRRLHRDEARPRRARGEQPEIILNNLYKHTQMQVNFGVIMLSIVNGQPREMGIIDCLKSLGFAYGARDWMQMNRSLFAALKLEKIAMFIILTLIILVAAFGIASTLFMMVMKKTRDIAILKSMGATRQSIMQIFIIDGLVIGGLGTVGGLGLGLALCALLKKYQFIKLPQEIYYISTLPVTIQAPDVLAIIVASMAISFIATLYPAWQASRLDPVEAIRYE